jgi:hypothetical protein
MFISFVFAMNAVATQTAFMCIGDLASAVPKQKRATARSLRGIARAGAANGVENSARRVLVTQMSDRGGQRIALYPARESRPAYCAAKIDEGEIRRGR